MARIDDVHSPGVSPPASSACGEAVAEFGAPLRCQPVRWPGLGIAGAALAECGGDDDDPVAAPAELRHHTTGEVSLVVGTGPDAEECAPALEEVEDILAG